MPLIALPNLMTNPSQTILIRPCVSFQELDACVDIQEKVWGYDERDIIPRRLFVVARRIGGQIFGAFPESDPKNMIAFCMALPAFRDQMPYLHSHMLAVLPEWRNSGIGRRLKLAQREDALARGIRLIEWTFDPLEIKNAFLNITRLGAIVRSYTPDFYGPLHSELQAGLQSDRLHAEWWLDSPRVTAALAGQPQNLHSIEQTITIPYQVAVWKSSPLERHKAIEIQAGNRLKLMQAFQQRLAVVGFKRDAQGNGVFELGHLSPIDFAAFSATAGNPNL